MAGSEIPVGQKDEERDKGPGGIGGEKVILQKLYLRAYPHEAWARVLNRHLVHQLPLESIFIHCL